jgi:hypothetical protein
MNPNKGYVNIMLIDKPGVYDIDAKTYHADPVIVPSLSSSISKILLEQSPRHAWLAHPRLNPEFEPEQNTKFDLGSAAHAYLLEGFEAFALIDAKNFRPKTAQEARDQAHADGKIPLLAADLATVKAMAGACRSQLARHEEAADAFLFGKPEQTLVWQEGEIWCRLRLDWLPAGGNVFYDYKSTGASANPEIWGQRQCFDMAFDVQAAFYRRGIKAVLGIEEAHFRFVVQEQDPPYAVSVIELAPAAINTADRKVAHALDLWRWCLSHDRWPGYPKRVAYVDAPVWAERKWLEREERDAIDMEAQLEQFRQLNDWQSAGVTA